MDGIRKTVTTRLQVWHNPRIAAATASSDFDVRDLRRQPMTIYVAVAPGDIPRMAPLLRQATYRAWPPCSACSLTS